MKYINIAPATNKASSFRLPFPVLPRQAAVIHPDIHSGKYPDYYPDNQPDGLRPVPSSCRIVTLILSYVGFYVLGFFHLLRICI